MKTAPHRVVVIIALSMAWALGSHVEGAERFLGSWMLTLPNGGTGWLGVEEKDGQLTAGLLWGGGSVMPMNDVAVKGDKLVITRVKQPRRKREGSDAKPITETITATRAGKMLHMTIQVQREGGKPTLQEFTGKWCPPVPPKPDVSKATPGDPVVLFDGTTLNAWKLTNPNQKNGWSIQDGEMVNNPVQPDDGHHVSYGNLRTVEEFEDFHLSLEVNVGERENSGVYLRGIYEVQVSDSYGRELDSHNMGAVYSRIAPCVSAEKPTGQWQDLDMTLLDRHITVVLNGKTIIDNEPVHGCTGGALWSDPFRPGPIYLQGDHTGIRYRDIVLTPLTR